MFKIRWGPSFPGMVSPLQGLKKCIMLLASSHAIQNHQRKTPHTMREAMCPIPMSWLDKNLSTKHSSGGSGALCACWVLVKSSRLQTLLYSALLMLKPSVSCAFLPSMDLVSGSEVWPGYFQCSSVDLIWVDLLHIKNNVASLDVSARVKIKEKTSQGPAYGACHLIPQTMILQWASAQAKKTL